MYPFACFFRALADLPDEAYKQFVCVEVRITPPSAWDASGRIANSI